MAEKLVPVTDIISKGMLGIRHFGSPNACNESFKAHHRTLIYTIATADKETLL
jgi:hypothetical protein